MKKYKQLTLEQRYQISPFLNLGLTQTAITKELGEHKSTLSKELKRNRSGRGYRPQFAERLAVSRRREKIRERIRQETWLEFEARIKVH